MVRNIRRKSSEKLRKELLDIIVDFEEKLKQDTLREQVIGLIPANYTLADLGSSLISEDLATSARSRILEYLKKFPRMIIRGDELMVVAGISEYGRRIRELRVQEGWPIASGITLKKMILAGDATLEDFGLENAEALRPDTY